MDISLKLKLAIEISREDVDFGVSMGYLTEDEGNAEFDRYVDELMLHDIEYLYTTQLHHKNRKEFSYA